MENNTIFGMPVYSSNHVPRFMPKVQLSSKVNVSDEFRKSYNKWLRKYFGEQEVCFVFDPTVLQFSYKKYTETTTRAKAITGNTLTIEKLNQAIKLMKDIDEPK